MGVTVTIVLIMGIVLLGVIPLALLMARAIRVSHPPSSLTAPNPASGAEGGTYPGVEVRGAPTPATFDPRRDASHSPQVQRWRDALEQIAAARCQTPYSGGSCAPHDKFYWCHPCIARGALDPRFGCTPIDPLGAHPFAHAEGSQARPGESSSGEPNSVSQGVPALAAEGELLESPTPLPQPDPLRREVTTPPGPSLSAPHDADGPGCVQNNFP